MRAPAQGSIWADKGEFLNPPVLRREWRHLRHVEVPIESAAMWCIVPKLPGAEPH
jgi:hypothetical protein